MSFYQVIDDTRTTCLLCGHYCKIKVGEFGVCKVNKNVGNKIECLVYGYPNAMNIDPIEKKPLYHFLPKTKTFSLGTVGCNFHCSFCQNWQLSQTDQINKENYYSAENIVKLALYYECDSISYTYNEPTIFFPYIQDIAKLAHQNGLKNIMVTNGFESKEVSESMVGLIDAVNVDLKSFDSEYYKKNLGGKIEVILRNLKYYVNHNIHTEITTLIVPTHNDKPEELDQIACFIANELGKEIVWHISAFHPDYKETQLPNTPVSILLKAKEIGYKNGLKNIYLGNVNIY